MVTVVNLGQPTGVISQPQRVGGKAMNVIKKTGLSPSFCVTSGTCGA